MRERARRVLAAAAGVVLCGLLGSARTTCVPIEPDEALCDPAVIGFPQDNPQAYEFYEVCVPRGAVDPQAELQAIDPTLYCGVGGVFAGCDREREVGCHGDLDYVAGTRRIADEKWQMLCELSVHPLVTRMGGGHFVR